jgi:lysophospholipase L1-like esterase
MDSIKRNQQDFHLSSTDQAARPDWVGAWYAAPIRMQATHLTGRTLYQIVHLHAGGQQIRLRFSNRYGESPLVLASVFVGRPSPMFGLPLHEEPVQPVFFQGQERISIEAGVSLMSDPIDFPVEALSDLAISFVVAEGDITTGHLFAQQTSYVSIPGNYSATTAWPWHTLLATHPLMTEAWWALTGVDVLPTVSSVNAVVVLGDSITDGTGSTRNTNRRWPDYLARRLVASNETRFMSVLNAGIGGNELLAADRLSWSGDAAIHRFAWDVLEQAGTTDLIILIGGNDLFNDASAEVLINGLQHLATRSREYGLRAFGSTIAPGSYTPAQAEQWSLVNIWLREQGTHWFAGVFYFATVLAHQEDKTRLDPAYDSGDGLHPNDIGYQRMAEAVDLIQLTGGLAL